MAYPPPQVQDLHAITPDEYLEMGESIFNNFSYQQARNNNLPCHPNAAGTYVAQAGHMLRQAGISVGSLILNVGKTPTPNVRALEAALASCPDGAQVPIRYMHVSNRHQSAVTMLRVDRRWHAMNRVVRDSSTPFSSDWVTSASPTPPFSSYSINASADSTAGRSAAEAAMLGRHPTPERKGKVRTRFAPGSNDAEKAISPSLVQVHFSMPYMIDGTAGAEFKGTGLVVDTEKGLVVVDRNTVPCSLGDVNISFGSSLHVPGRVCFIHPLHNIAVLSYDPKVILFPRPPHPPFYQPIHPPHPAPPGPKSVGDTPVKAALLCTDEDMTHEKKGTKVTLVGLSGGLRGGTQLSSHEAKVKNHVGERTD